MLVVLGRVGVGLHRLRPRADVVASWQTAVNAVGAYNTDLVVLGNGGRITMTFDLRAVGVVNRATA